MNTLAREKKEMILKCLTEGNSLRGTARLVGVQRNTVAKLAMDAGRLCEALHEELVRDLTPAFIQVDEMWGFVYAKEKHLDRVSDAAPPWAGSTWTWVGIDPVTKLVPAWYVSTRTTAAAKIFIGRLRKSIQRAHFFQLSSDGFSAYPSAVLSVLRSTPVSYGQYVKEYDGSRFVGSHHEFVKGVPDPAHIGTTFIERLNLTVRMSVRRYARQTNAFSKRLAPHVAATALHFFCYNFLWVHGSLGCTPAQAAGLTKRQWTYDDLVGLIEAAMPRPVRPARYRTAKRRRRWQVRPEANAVSK